jgi:hydroxymethylpyrimidine/phosphomethylpyrimidine kinase
MPCPDLDEGDPMICVLSIAGSDSGGGAGIQADLKAFSAQGVYGATVLTALTAQNTKGVQAVRAVEPDFVAAQLDSVFDDIPIVAVKVGMLPNPGVMEAVASRLARFRPRWVVVDPVMVAKGGHALMDGDAVEAFRRLILPLCDVVTPNLPEAAALTGLLPTSDAEMEEAGWRLLQLGAKAALVKGGHLEGRPDDVLVRVSGAQVFPGERLDARHSHGTGCSLSSALTALLARGVPLEVAVAAAKDYVAEGIRRGPAIGSGVGPIHHFWNLWPEERS